ncbi:MAG TPA: c-type cytochrome domain-containing protein [Opitutaceae bacterium]|nr:c-type cytochrome domain-containing protein [Opitutaceae bacterium]
MRLACLLLLAGASPGWAEPATFADRVAPVLEHNCTKCHGATKQKAGLRLDSHAAVLAGSKDGEVVKPGDAMASELFRRITLPPADDDFMPSGDRPPLSPAEIAVLENWIAAGTPATDSFDAARLGPAVVAPPAAPDYRPRLAEATELARTLGVRLVPRSRVPTDGLVLRTASAPAACDDAVLAKLAPVAGLIVDAELARTRVTDKGLEAVGRWSNLAHLDLTRTAVTSDGVAQLASLGRLETLNLTGTRVDGRGLTLAGKLPALRRVWTFGGP